jgi:molybdopterin molybdotransferase
MILFEQAQKIVMAEASRVGATRVALTMADGRILAEDIHSDIDMPPFDKSAVDGYACRKADLKKNLSIRETIAAGVEPKYAIAPGTCSKIMTGAKLPTGADTVIMVEDTEEFVAGTIHFNSDGAAPNICLRGEDIRAGQKVLEAGTLLRPQEIAVLASVGSTIPLVSVQPRVSIMTTGDELVKPPTVPAGAKIRDSNSYQLEAQITRTGAIPVNLGIVADNENSIREVLLDALQDSDIVLLTGGVSMGDYDYVPDILKSAGVKILFRTISIQPGKPTVFGTRQGRIVFGLPGNPVSCFILFEMLVKPLLLEMMGCKNPLPSFRIRLGADLKRRKSERKAFIPVSVREGEAYPIDYHGSAHIHAYTHANGIICMEIGVEEMKKGSFADVRPV